jgi:Domain of unknown function (DUF4157)
MSARIPWRAKAAMTPKPFFVPSRNVVLQSKCACGGKSGASGECEECRNKRLQRQIGNRQSVIENESVVPPIVHEVLRSPGQPLNAATRAFMEPRFGHDFSRVRVHTDARAVESARSVGGLAYTVGRDVVFDAGRYVPQTRPGRWLLAHELAHVVQQEQAPGPCIETISNPGDALEHDADRAAGAVTNEKPFVLGGMIGAPPAVQRQKGEEKKPPTPEEIAAKQLKAGPTGDRAAFTKITKSAAEAEKKGTAITRVEVPTKDNDEVPKMLGASEFKTQHKACGRARQEGGLPEAFLCATHAIAVPDVAPDESATLATNVRVAFSGSASSGGLSVKSASLPWELNTTAFLNIGVIDPRMLKPYSDHEKGHRTLAHQIRDKLAKLFQLELEQSLPTDKKPLKKSGADWSQKAVDDLIKQITTITTRYSNWMDQLLDKADADWDAQEKKTLSDIAAAKRAAEPKPGGSPELK